MKKLIIISKIDADIRLDKWLKKNFSSLKQSFIEKNLRKKNILVNNLKKSANYRLSYKDKVTIKNYDSQNYYNLKIIKKYNIPLKLQKVFNDSIVYENNQFIILNKWTGVSSQGGSKITIAIDHIIKNISSSYNLVHRLDKETSGLLIIAKNLKYTKIFGEMFRNKKIDKKYIAICEGKPKFLESIIKVEIPKKEKVNLKQETETYYKVLNIKKNFSLILFVPKTGKTHQLRIVSKKLGCPIIGDNKYNIQSKFIKEKLKLNAYKLNFILNDEDYKFISHLPEHFLHFMDKNKIKFPNDI